ncbi:CBO0543 family protein [Lederbergia citri]|uniref:CBO0543 family protein n=1 Tax=Lederbergia citri TaxID=2833580 RepID=UPI0038996756
MPWKNLNSQQWQRILSLNRYNAYFIIIIFAILIGSSLDLYFVKNNYYEFPIRPFPNTFSINIGFTLCILPAVTWLYLFIMKKINRLERFIVIIMICFLVPIGEQVSEHLGLFLHSEKWKHSYSSIGYFLYLIIVWKIFQWMYKKK